MREGLKTGQFSNGHVPLTAGMIVADSAAGRERIRYSVAIIRLFPFPHFVTLSFHVVIIGIIRYVRYGVVYRNPLLESVSTKLVVGRSGKRRKCFAGPVK